MKRLVLLALIGCSHRSISEHKNTYDQLTPEAFNRYATRANEPVYWVADANHDRRIDPDEITGLLFYPSDEIWVSEHRFTRAFDTAYNRIIAAWHEDHPKAELAPDPPTDPDGRIRRHLVRKELDLGPVALVRTDLRDLAFVPHLVAAARLVDRLYDVQAGAAALAAKLPDDLESRSLFRRDHGAACISPAYRMDPACSAVPAGREQPVDVYPVVLQLPGEFCSLFSRRTIDPFSVEHGATSTPYAAAYSVQSRAIATELSAVADAMTDPDDADVASYLRAAAASFGSNDWASASAAFRKIDPRTSRWYVRVGPDDTTWDPCHAKAGFHMTFARRVAQPYPWQQAIAELGAVPVPYDLVLAAGYSRQPRGATALERHDGTAIVFANLFANEDAAAVERRPVEEVLDKASLAGYQDRREADVLLAMLGELVPPPAGTSLGPELDPAFTELRRRSAALARIEELDQRGAIGDELATQSYLAAIIATISRMDELFDKSGNRLTTPNASGMLVGMLVDHGALTWQAASAVSGAPGAFSVHPAQVASAITVIANTVDDIVRRGDRKEAAALAARYSDEAIVPYGVIAYRFRIAAVPSYVYSVIY